MPRLRYIFPDLLNSKIADFYPQFNSEEDVVVINAAPLVGNKNYLKMTAEEIADICRPYIYNNTKVIFLDQYEGVLFYATVPKMHDIIKILNIDESNVYHISGTVNARSLYNNYCNDNNILKKVHVYYINYWEYHIKVSTGVDITYKITHKEKLFLCFNRINRTHRTALAALILENNLLERSYYSLLFGCHDGEPSTIKHAFKTAEYCFPKLVTTLVQQHFLNQSKFPLTLNTKHNENTAYLLPDDVKYFENSYLSLVTETGYLHDTIFFSEKIYKPIRMKHPFILVSSTHSLKYLHKLGFKTFHPLINEAYDDISDPSDRLIAIVEELNRLNLFTPEQFIDWQTAMLDIVDHNHAILLNRTQYDFIIDDHYN